MIQILSMMIAVVGLLIFQKLSKALQVFVVYLVIASCTELLSYLFAKRNVSNLYFLHAFTLLEFWFISIFFNRLVDFTKLKLSLNSVLLIGASLIIGNTVFLQGLDQFNSYSATFVSAIILLMCLVYFYNILESNEVGIESKTIKWFVIGLFFYHCVSLSVLIFSNHMIDTSVSTQSIIWTTRAFLILATKLLYLIALCNYTFNYLKNYAAKVVN